VFCLCKLEKRPVELKLGHLLSREVVCTTMSFLQIWSLSYNLPIGTYYSVLSLLSSCLCFDDDGSSSRSRRAMGIKELSKRKESQSPELII
jgi:hypothetical protein